MDDAVYERLVHWRVDDKLVVGGVTPRSTYQQPLWIVVDLGSITPLRFCGSTALRLCSSTSLRLHSSTAQQLCRSATLHLRNSTTRQLHTQRQVLREYRFGQGESR